MSTLNEILYETQLDQIYIDQEIFNAVLEETIIGEGAKDLAHTIWEKIKEICKNIAEFFRKIGKWIKEKFLKIIGKSQKDVKEKVDAIVEANPQPITKNELMVIKNEDPGSIKKLFNRKYRPTQKQLPAVVNDYDYSSRGDSAKQYPSVRGRGEVKGKTDYYYEEDKEFDIPVSFTLSISCPSIMWFLTKVTDSKLLGNINNAISKLQTVDTKNKVDVTDRIGTKSEIFDKDEEKRLIAKDLRKGMSSKLGGIMTNTKNYLNDCDGGSDQLFSWSEYKSNINKDLSTTEKYTLDYVFKNTKFETFDDNIKECSSYLNGDYKKQEAEYARAVKFINQMNDKVRDNKEALSILLKSTAMLQEECTNITNIRLNICKDFVGMYNRVATFVYNNIYARTR